MEIHARYYEQNIYIPSTPQQSTEDASNLISEKMFQLIKDNRVKALLELFKAIEPAQLYPLVNRKNKNFENMLPINFAIKCSANHLIFVMLLRLGARVDHSSDPPLIHAVRSGQMNLVKILMISGADVNVLDIEGYSILHWACFKRNSLMVRLILKLPDFTFHNHDRNSKRTSPLGNVNNVSIICFAFFLFRYFSGIEVFGAC